MKGLFLFLGLLSAVAVARPLTYEEKLSDLLQLAALIKSQYGPYEYKQKQIKVDPDTLVGRYAKLAAAATNTEFYYLLNRFIAEFKDSHFGGQVQSSLIAKLGFFIDRVDGKALIDEIDRKVLPETAFPCERGDEILSIGGKSVELIVEELGAHLGSGFIDTNRRSATILLSYRPASNVPAPAGKTKVEVKRASGKVETYELEWKHEGEFIEDSMPAATTPKIDYAHISVAESFDYLPRSEKNFRCSGKTRIQIPEGAVKLIEEPFVAYYHATPKGNVGYLRIPHYYWKNATTQAEEYEIRFKQYEWAVEQLEKHTVGLVIDQDHNCGGSVMFLERMVGLFADKPYLGLQFQFIGSRQEYHQFKSWVEGEKKFTVEGADFQNVLDLMKASWVKGEFMTPKTTFQNNRLYQPNRIRYTNPILMLIDEMSGSGGDAFPAMLQGMGRAKLLGTRTMGAGGHVVEFAPLNYSAVKLRMTKSLFYHPDGTAIENNGVTPEVAYTPTRADFMNGYRDYQKTYLGKLMELLD